MGYDDKEKNKPLQKDAIWRIASQTKAITSVAVMMLYDDGKILLNEPISRYLPEFKKPVVLDKFNPADSTYTTIPAKREITIRDLLTHTSGVGYAQIGSETMNAIYAKAGVVGGIAGWRVAYGTSAAISLSARRRRSTRSRAMPSTSLCSTPGAARSR